jgi:LAO/AO transport system kinase
VASTRGERILAGDLAAAAQLMRDLDDRVPAGVEDLKRLYPQTGAAFAVGITGSPGVGKSTVVDGLITRYRAMGERVGVVAIDPTSPFSGGALLGDRVRMQGHATDAGVFIRSLATRGQLGGLSRSTGEVVDVLDAAGFSLILIETVGVGQAEVDVVSTADVTVVVTAPGLGDEVQALKAGLLEIAEILVVNKADREGADRAIADLTTMCALGRRRHAHDIEIIRAIASKGEGLDQLVAAIERLRQAPGPIRVERRRRRAERQVLALVTEITRDLLLGKIGSDDNRGRLAQIVEEVASRRQDPYSAAQALAAAILIA